VVKIAFIGSHGVGKTTLCYDLAAALKRRGLNVDIVKEVARLSPLPINRQTSLDAQLWILMTQVAEEVRSASHHDAVVCDRSVLDNYAYLARACGRQPELEQFVDYWLRSYDLLVKVPVTGKADADGVRDVDEQFVRAIDGLVDDLLAEKHLAHQRLDPEHRESWAEAVRDIVGRLIDSGTHITPPTGAPNTRTL
jgi:nicotinamide riboside kinase